MWRLGEAHGTFRQRLETQYELLWTGFWWFDDFALLNQSYDAFESLDEIGTEDVQRLKAALTERAPKTVNNVLTVLSVVLRTAVEWGVIARVPCSIKLLKAPKSEASFHDFDEFERLVGMARPKRWPSWLSCSAARRDCDAARSWRSSGLTSTSPSGN